MATVTKVLFVCDEDNLRSPTGTAVYGSNTDLEVRSAGFGRYSSQRVSEDMLQWADIVFVMERRHRNRIHKAFPRIYAKKRIICLYIPDEFDYMDSVLVRLLTSRCSPYIDTPAGTVAETTDE